MDILTDDNEQRKPATNGHSLNACFKDKKGNKKPVKTDIFVYNLIPYPESEP